MPVEDPIEAFLSVPEAYSPRVSPDNERVVCCWNETDRFELHAYHLVTGERHQLTDGHLPMNPKGSREPEHARHRWDHGNDGVVFQGPKTGEGTPVYRASLDGSVEELFVAEGTIEVVAVNPKTGCAYYRLGDETLCWQDPRSGETGCFPEYPGLPMTVRAPWTVSPDGQSVAYMALSPDADENEIPQDADWGTYITRADGSDQTLVRQSSNGHRIVPVQWHPESDRLLITCDEGHHLDDRRCGIYDRESETIEWIADDGAVAFFDDATRILLGAMPRDETWIVDLQGDVTSVDCEGKFYQTAGSDAVVDDTGFVFIRRNEDRHYGAFHHDLTTGETTRLFGAEYDTRPIGPRSIVSPIETTYELPDGGRADGLQR